ncbi:MAG: 1-deoxy-D-xylulose-5-phosphate reductoisomerase [Verrucomicrobia bacterium]|nr:MAG: 1-deoxy-D-xylulose-5-phosphate reductoisomerase [Verrucomicrobiota bacterium]
MRKRRVLVLGITGSIGASVMQVAREFPEHMEIVGMSAFRNVEKLAQAIQEFRPKAVCVGDSSSAAFLKSEFTDGMSIFSGEEGLIHLVTETAADVVLIAIVGTGGLRPALAAIEAGCNLALASKEILVMAGEVVTRAAQKAGVLLLPVDSEHNAIFQCLEGRSMQEVRRLILTCSGGPFRLFPTEKLAEVTPEMALRHPTWNMGCKITIDSATLFNKGLELIEAHWLFGTSMNQIDVTIHPQSIIHSLVEFVDGSILAQMGTSDMRLPIQHTIMWPERVASSRSALKLEDLSRLEFFTPRWDDFPALRLARHAGETGGTLPAVLNAANEMAVEAFLEKQISLPRIWEVVSEVMDQVEVIANPDLQQILEADAQARRLARLTSLASVREFIN